MRLSIALLSIIVLAAGMAFADGLAGSSGDFFILYFDENGNAHYTTPTGGDTLLQGTLQNDPTRTGLRSLIYQLPENVIPGDVRIWEDDSELLLSDVLRFTDANGDLTGTATVANLMIYYSDVGDSDLADTNGIPTVLSYNDSGGIVETGSEGGFRDFDWYPGGHYPTNNEYVGTSDVPEPSSVGLLASVLVGAVMMLRRRRTV